MIRRPQSRWTAADVAAVQAKRTKVAPTPLAEMRKIVRGPYKSKLEADYASVLQLRLLAGEIRSWKYEAVKLRLGGGAFFTPDFYVVWADGSQEFYEVKGFMREAANVRLKVAIEQFPEFRFFLVTRSNGAWDVRAK